MRDLERMGIKWTPEYDQLLLLKILETHQVQIKGERIREAWPKDKEAPTARAITERIFRLRGGHREFPSLFLPS